VKLLPDVLEAAECNY